MRSNKQLILTLLMLIVVAALYRVIPDRQPGFAPHLAMALFGGAIIRDKKWAFALPVFSMFISDLLYQAMYLSGITPIAGFYEGQLLNYVLFAAMTCMGFFLKRITVAGVAGFSFLVALGYFLLSNFFVWTSGSGYARPMTGEGLLMVYADGLPFFGWSLAATWLFSAILFGSYQLLTRRHAAVA